MILKDDLPCGVLLERNPSCDGGGIDTKLNCFDVKLPVCNTVQRIKTLNKPLVIRINAKAAGTLSLRARGTLRRILKFALCVLTDVVICLLAAQQQDEEKCLPEQVAQSQ